jgi:hypothetical protein
MYTMGQATPFEAGQETLEDIERELAEMESEIEETLSDLDYNNGAVAAPPVETPPPAPVEKKFPWVLVGGAAVAAFLLMKR